MEQEGHWISLLRYHVDLSRKPKPVKTVSAEINPLKGKRKGAALKEEVWFEEGQVIAYNLAYINLKRCHVDHGRALGFDNSHGYHHRHFMGRVEAVTSPRMQPYRNGS